VEHGLEDGAGAAGEGGDEGGAVGYEKGAGCFWRGRRRGGRDRERGGERKKESELPTPAAATAWKLQRESELWRCCCCFEADGGWGASEENRLFPF